LPEAPYREKKKKRKKKKKKSQEGSPLYWSWEDNEGSRASSWNIEQRNYEPKADRVQIRSGSFNRRTSREKTAKNIVQVRLEARQGLPSPPHERGPQGCEERTS